MRAERDCARLRPDISARLDGEVDRATGRALDEHLQACAACRDYEAALQRARQAVRLQSVPDVPDLTDKILEQVRREAAGRSGRAEWYLRARIASIAAAAAALILLGASLPWQNETADIARADEIVAEVRLAARTLDAYEATFEIDEWGWHPDIPVRTFTAKVMFDAPEAFSLRVRDLTSYPDGRWPRNDVDLVSNGSRWWLREPATCPTAALPDCALSMTVEERTMIQRKPFDGTTPLPTDIVVPLEAVASSDDFRVVAQRTWNGRPVYKVSLPYRQAAPLVEALQSGGSWRPFHPLDRVDAWIDRSSWFPLAFDVSAGRSPDRAAWAQGQGLGAERPGQLLLRARSVSFSQPRAIQPGPFDVPAGGVVTSGGFRASSPPASAPRTIAGLPLVRHGTTEAGRVLAYASGTTWLRIERMKRATAAPALDAEEVRLADGYVYYQPADDSFGRRVDIYGERYVHLESNLPRDELLVVAATVAPGGRRGRSVLDQGTLTIRRVRPARVAALPFVALPRWLPSGYPEAPSVALLSRSRKSDQRVTLYYRRAEAEYEGFGIRITHARPIALLPPSSEQLLSVRVRGHSGRWSAERGELEWVEGRVYRAVAVPSFDLATALQIARRLVR